MLTTFQKKIFGSSVLVFVLCSSFFAFGTDAGAQLIQSFSSVVADGVVSGVSGGGFSLMIDGGVVSPIQVNNGTVFTNGISFGTLTVGDRVSVIARREAGGVIARLVRLIPGTGYSVQGNRVVLMKTTIMAKTATTFTVQTSGVLMTFQVTPATLFVHTSFSLLVPGDGVQVLGVQLPGGTIATHVIAK